MNLANRKLSQRLNPHGYHITNMEYIVKLEERMRERTRKIKKRAYERRMKEGVLVRKKEEKILKETEEMVAGAG